MALITTAPEWLGSTQLEFLNFLAMEAQHVSAPPPIVDICAAFIEKSNSTRSVANFNARLCQIRGNFHKLDELDTDTKVKMMFVYRAPVDGDFLDFLRKDAVVEVDDRNRIIKYQNNQGLQLCGLRTKRRRNYAAKSKVSSKSDEESDSEPDSEPDEHEDGDVETKEKEEPIISQTSSGRIARKRTFYDELLTPSKVPRKTDVKFEGVSISKRPSPTTRKQEIEYSQKFPERNQTGKHVHFAAKVSICTYDDDWDSSSDDVSPDEVEGLDMYRPDQEKYHCHKEAKKAVRFDPIVTVFPIPPRDANRSFEINNNDASCSDINLSQQPKKSVRFAENVSIHSYENFSDSSSDSGVDDFDEHFNSLDDFDEIIDRELNRLQVRDGEKEQETLKLAEPAYDAFDMMSPKEFMKVFDNMSKTFNLQSINATQLNLPEEIVLLEQDDQKTLTNIFDDFLNALKMVPDGEQKVSPNVNVTTRNEIFLVLRAIMVTLNSPSLEPMNLKLSKIMDEFQGSDPIVPVETLRAALKSLLQTVQAVCIAKPV